MNEEPVMELRGIRRAYPMGAHTVEALKDVDFAVERGEFVAIVGPSGSGKSTLMYVLGCLDTPTAGTYRLLGRDVTQLGDVALSRVRNREIGFVFQQFYLLPELDVTDNIALGMAYAGRSRQRRRARAQELAEQVGLGDRVRHTPGELSGGQAQRVGIARALSMEPGIILADEPTGNLDTRTGGEIMAFFRELHAQGKTVVVVTHDRDIAAQADRLIRLVDGRIVEDRAHSERGGRTSPAPGPPAPAGSSGRLGWRDLLRMAVREGLLAHKLRSFLTMLGIVFGIAAVIIMTAITEGGKRRQIEQLRQIGLRNIFVRSRDLRGPALLRERRVNPFGLAVGDREHLAHYVNGVQASAAWKTLRVELRCGKRVLEDADVLGVLGDFQTVVNYHVAPGGGRFLDALDQREYARVCVLGPDVARELGLRAEPLGRWIIVGDQPFEVVGVMERKAFSKSDIQDVSIRNRNREVYVPFRTLESFFSKDPKASVLDTIALSMTSEEDLVDKSRLVKHIIASLHRQAEDFSVSVPLEKLRQARKTEQVFNLIIIVIAAISLVVGGIGIMNIMLATVTERTREIGIRRAIGAARRDVMGQFLTEALLLSTLGGLIGMALGVLGGSLVEWVFGFGVAFSELIVLVAALVSMAVGVCFGLYPAWIAANMDPVEALRN